MLPRLGNLALSLRRGGWLFRGFLATPDTPRRNRSALPLDEFRPGSRVWRYIRILNASVWFQLWPRRTGRRGAILGHAHGPLLKVLPLQSPKNASPFWITFLLSWARGWDRLRRPREGCFAANETPYPYCCVVRPRRPFPQSDRAQVRASRSRPNAIVLPIMGGSVAHWQSILPY